MLYYNDSICSRIIFDITTFGSYPWGTSLSVCFPGVTLSNRLRSRAQHSGLSPFSATNIELSAQVQATSQAVACRRRTADGNSLQLPSFRVYRLHLHLAHTYTQLHLQFQVMDKMATPTQQQRQIDGWVYRMRVQENRLRKICENLLLRAKRERSAHVRVRIPQPVVRCPLSVVRRP